MENLFVINPNQLHMDSTIQDLLQAGAHFGHQSRYWNPKMKKYIYGTYNHINIINLEYTLIGLRRACEFVHDLASSRKKLLLVGTKKAAGDIIKEGALAIGQYYVNHRWMGGTLTNYSIICASIYKLNDLNKQKAEGMFHKLTKKEAMMRTRSMLKLERNIGGIKDMNGLPDALFVVDVRHERIAVAEANKLGIPVIGVVDSNSNPDNIDYVIPGNDDSIRSISLLVKAITSSFSEGEQLAEQYSMMRSDKKGLQDSDGQQSKSANLAVTLSKNRKSSENKEMQDNQNTNAVNTINEETTKEENSSTMDTEEVQISASAVKELREMSGAGIMECKKSLKEAKGDINKAANLLRESGLAKQLKRSGRDASEGIVAVRSQNNKAIAVEINCETDFVARNDDFVDFADRVAEAFYKEEPQLDGETPQLSKQVEEDLQQISQKMGEKLVINKYISISAPENGTVGAYVHTTGKLCALVAIDGDEPQLAKDLAMQVAAMSPIAFSPEDVPQELIEKEKEIFIAQIKDEDKPDDIKEKMITGKLKKFAAEVSLTEQSFFKDPDKKISDLIKAAGVKEVKFLRHSIGTN